MPPKIPISTHMIMGITFTPANPLVDVMRYISHGGKPPLHTLFFLTNITGRRQCSPVKRRKFVVSQ